MKRSSKRFSHGWMFDSAQRLRGGPRSWLRFLLRLMASESFGLGCSHLSSILPQYLRHISTVNVQELEHHRIAGFVEARVGIEPTRNVLQTLLLVLQLFTRQHLLTPFLSGSLRVLGLFQVGDDVW